MSSSTRTFAAENKVLIHRLYDEAINRQDAGAAAGFYAIDAMNHGRVVGRVGMRRVFEALFSIFPDFHYEILGEMVHDCQPLIPASENGAHTHPLIGPLAGSAGSPLKEGVLLSAP